MKHPHGFSDCQTLNPEAAPGCISSRCHNTTRRERWAYNNHVSIHIYINYINRLNIPIIIINYLYNYEQRYKLEMEIARFMDLTFDVGRYFFLAQGKQTVRRVHLVSECFAHKWYHIQQKNMNLPAWQAVISSTLCESTTAMGNPSFTCVTMDTFDSFPHQPWIPKGYISGWIID
jgi:hypothetical protein